MPYVLPGHSARVVSGNEIRMKDVAIHLPLFGPKARNAAFAACQITEYQIILSQ